MVNATSRVIRVETRGPASVLTHTTIPCPTPKSTQVLVKVVFAGINFIDVNERIGAYPTPVPFTPGREGAGEIVEVGGEVQHGFKVGDRVAFLGLATYADYVAVDTVNLAKLPDSVSYEDGAALMIQGLTALSLATKAYPIQRGDIIVIHAAAGGVGLILSQIASRRLGATVIGTVSTEEKATLARANGAHHVVVVPSTPAAPGTKNPYEPLEALVNQLTNNKGVHAVFDSVGKATFESDLVIARRSATLVFYGFASGIVPDFNINRLTAKNLKVTRISLYNYMTTFEEFDELYKEGLELLKGEDRIKLEVSKVYDFKDIQQAHLDLEGRKTTGKLLLKVAGSN